MSAEQTTASKTMPDADLDRIIAATRGMVECAEWVAREHPAFLVDEKAYLTPEQFDRFEATIEALEARMAAIEDSAEVERR